MPNIFDQFDQPQARLTPPAVNVFDQFDVPDLPAQRPVNTPERQALQAELDKRLAAADEAGEDLDFKERYAEGMRPILRGATDLADGVTSLPRLAAAIPVGALNLAGANIRSPLSVSVTDIADEIRQVGRLGKEDTNPSARQRLAPRNDSERVASTITQGLGSVLTGVGLGSLAAGAGGTAGAIGSQFAAQPALQTASAVTSGAASEGARKYLGAGPVGQTVAGILGSIAPGAAVGAAQKIGAGLKRTPEAQRLLDRGVDLTPGQMNPKGFVNQLEETVQSAPWVGTVVRGARDNARSSFQRAAAEAGAAPGTRIQQADDAAQMLDDAYQSFQPLYNQAKGFPARPAIVNASSPDIPLDQAFSRAVSNRGVRATAEDRSVVQNFLDDQLTKPLRSSDDLLNVRSAVRAESRSASSSGQTAQAQLLDDADAALTQALDSQLPPDALKALKTADAKYGDYKTVEKAVYTGATKPGEFTPFDLSKAVRQSNRGDNQGSYARGGGGPLRQLADDATKSLETRAPATGARLAAYPAAAVAGPAILGLAGTQTGRRIAQGGTDFQRRLAQALQQFGLRGGAGARAGATQEAIEALTDQERLALAFQEATQRRKERR